MFEGALVSADHSPVGLSSGDLAELLGRLTVTSGLECDDTERINLIGLLERLKGAAAAAQARISVAFDASQRRAQAAAGVPGDQRGRGVADQIALARGESPVRGSRHLGLAKALVAELPHTHAALSRGEISEWAATLVARETAVLEVEDRMAVDAGLASRLGRLSDRALERAARGLALERDPNSPLRRIRGAVADRRVWVRPAPDTMALVTGLVPVEQGVAVYASLRARAASLIASGDPRGRGQIMADEFVCRLTGVSQPEDLPVEIGLVMTDTALFAGAGGGARIVGGGPIPAAVARAIAAGSGRTAEREQPGGEATANGDGGADSSGFAADPRHCALDRRGPEGEAAGRAPFGRSSPSDPPTPAGPSELTARRWVRRLYADPERGELIGMDRRRRLFGGALRKLLIARDQTCRTPWCDAPIQDLDHVTPVRDGGDTTIDNGQGLCRRCNQAKEMPGWAVRGSVSNPVTGEPVPLDSRGSPGGPTHPSIPAPSSSNPAPSSGGHVVTVRTPTGHTYRSLPPPVLECFVRYEPFATLAADDSLIGSR